MAKQGFFAYSRYLVLGLVLLTSGWGIVAYSAGSDAGISSAELVERLATPAELLVLDVRSSKEFQAGHVPGARHIPHTELPQRLTELVGYQQKTVVVYCESGVRAKTAFRVLQTAGFANVRHLQGDMAAWRDQGLPLTIPAGRP